MKITCGLEFFIEQFQLLLVEFQDHFFKKNNGWQIYLCEGERSTEEQRRKERKYAVIIVLKVVILL